jgi:hypothetical protein
MYDNNLLLKYTENTSVMKLTQQLSHVFTHIFLVLSQKHELDEFKQLQMLIKATGDSELLPK